MEAAHSLAIGRAKGDVDRSARRPVVAEEELSNLDGMIALPCDLKTQYADDAHIKASAGGEIAYAEVDVIDQESVFVAQRA